MLQSDKSSEPDTPDSNTRLASGGEVKRDEPTNPLLQQDIFKQKKKSSARFNIILVVIIVLFVLLVLVTGLFFYNMFHHSSPPSPCGNSPTSAYHDLPSSLAQGICVDNHNIGVSEGSIILVKTEDKEVDSYKQQAAKDLQQGHLQQAWQELRQALKLDPSDGEAQIYAENLRVLMSSCPYIVIVVPTMLTTSGTGSTFSDYTGVGRDDLQGAFIADYEFNGSVNQQTLYKCSGQSTGTKALLLIANSGSHNDMSSESMADVTRVVNQIIFLSQDHSFAGVIGWPFSAGSLIALPLLQSHHIVMVSQTSTSDSLHGSYFFRIAPANQRTAQIAAQYAKNYPKLLASKVAVIFYDASPTSYSKSLANDFSDYFNHEIPGVQNATQVDCINLNAAACLKQVQKQVPNADLIFFTGYADAFDAFRGQMFAQKVNIPIMGGDTLYELHNYTTNYKKFYFVSFSYPDNTKILLPQFSSIYSGIFDAISFDPQQTKAGAYGFGRADNDAILSFDAMHALLTEYNTVLQQSGGKVTEEQFNTALSNMPKPIQGASGSIQFDQNGNPIDKSVLLFYVDESHHTHWIPTN